MELKKNPDPISNKDTKYGRDEAMSLGKALALVGNAQVGEWAM